MWICNLQSCAIWYILLKAKLEKALIGKFWKPPHSFISFTTNYIICSLGRTEVTSLCTSDEQTVSVYSSVKQMSWDVHRSPPWYESVLFASYLYLGIFVDQFIWHFEMHSYPIANMFVWYEYICHLCNRLRTRISMHALMYCGRNIFVSVFVFVFARSDVYLHISQPGNFQFQTEMVKIWKTNNIWPCGKGILSNRNTSSCFVEISC